jgi:hypothetical protein
MAGESDDLDKLFESVADGESVDWDALERNAPDEESRALIRRAAADRGRSRTSIGRRSMRSHSPKMPR